MDPLSDVLSLLKPRSYMFRGLDAGGDWAIRFPEQQGIRCYATLSGQCWLGLEGLPTTVLLSPGDCVLLPRGYAVRLASDLSLPPADAMAVFPRAREGGIASLNGGGGTYGLGGFFEFAGRHAEVLLGVLPPIVHIREEADKAALRSSIEQIMQELREPQQGSFLVAQHLAHLMLVKALRLFLKEGSGGGVGWIYALADKQIGAAINAMHDDPAHKWTIQSLAVRACMSRSSFALKFRQTVGESPMEYLTRWRMLLAGDRLTNSSDPVSVIAATLGYESESSFSAAFKRVMKCSPRDYGRRHKLEVMSEKSLY